MKQAAHTGLVVAVVSTALLLGPLPANAVNNSVIPSKSRNHSIDLSHHAKPTDDEKVQAKRRAKRAKILAARRKRLAIKGTSPAAAKRIAKLLLIERGQSAKQYRCLVNLWQRESGWRVQAGSPGMSYGIPQAYPGHKMASAGRKWRTDPTTQIRWGLSYIQDRYGTPCGAWAHFTVAYSY
ncbi:MAG: transglycosylase SLT domain-containing protein [Bifidobacteriaceae bacterium]|nr:transglycosylase SLT domain-containing protein [Bifidobacteriaceae bacterium]